MATEIKFSIYWVNSTKCQIEVLATSQIIHTCMATALSTKCQLEVLLDNPQFHTCMDTALSTKCQLESDHLSTSVDLVLQ